MTIAQEVALETTHSIWVCFVFFLIVFFLIYLFDDDKNTKK